MAAVEAVLRHAKPRTILRPTAATITDGYAIKNAPIGIPANIAVQPLTGKQVRNLPPGQNASDIRNVWSDTELRPLDQVDVGGVRFTVEALLYWEEGKFWHAQAARAIDRLSTMSVPTQTKYQRVFLTDIMI